MGEHGGALGRPEVQAVPELSDLSLAQPAQTDLPLAKELIEKAKAVAANLQIEVREGVYFCVTGPTYETPAEYKMIHIIGGDAVGMSTVQECIVANHMGLPVFAMSVITDLGIREDHAKITHEEVLHFAKAAEPKLAAIFKELVAVL